MNNLWNSNNQEDWKQALDNYYNAVMSNHVVIEKEMENLDATYIANMNVEEFYDFLYDKYFYWKYTAANRLATTRMNLAKYKVNNLLHELEKIHNEIFNNDLNDIEKMLRSASSIKGLGIAGASGLLSLLFPDKFGTVDQFIIESLLKIKNLEEKSIIEKMNKNNITLKNGAILISIYRQKANELNRKFNTNFWTPRKIDMILWSNR
ncbi:MAG: hypothetical protein MJ229_02470 [bacterium]|nr:hypothetical protein [bacterium]